MNFDPYLAFLESRKRCSPQTIKAYRSDLLFFAAFLKGRCISRLTKVNHSVITDYIDDMRQKPNPRFGRVGVSDASIARRLAAVSGYMEYVRAEDEPKLRNPIKDFPNSWKKNNHPKPVDELTLELLLTGISSLRDRTLFNLFLSTGLRVSEMHQLNLESIKIEVEPDKWGVEHVIGSGTVIGKGSKRRSFYVDNLTLVKFAQYRATRTDENPALFLSERKQRLSVRAIQDTLSKLCLRLGAPHINVHRLRHTYATRLANANISSVVLMQLMGHKSFTTTQQYFKLSDQTLSRGYYAAMETVK